MRKPVIAATIAVFALGASQAALAQQMMPLPPFNNTFSSANLTRGLWFTAPTDFIITGLRVPDESNHGLQNIEVVRMDGNQPPPTFNATTNAFVSLERHIGIPSAQIVSVNIPVATGEVIGILGAAGDSSMMRNSYGTVGSFPSEIFGEPIVLRRFGMQSNLVTTTAQDVFESSGTVGRVEMYYIPAPGAFLPFIAGALLVARRRR